MLNKKQRKCLIKSLRGLIDLVERYEVVDAEFIRDYEMIDWPDGHLLRKVHTGRSTYRISMMVDEDRPRHDKEAPAVTASTRGSVPGRR